MVLWWILIGMGLASLAAAYIPRNIFSNYMGPTVLGHNVGRKTAIWLPIIAVPQVIVSGILANIIF